MWEINRTGLTTSSFSVLIQIVGITNLRFLTVRFIAVDIFFPHYLNSYDNVPVNYSAGPLVNISVKGTTTSPSFYTNTINFTKQSAGRQYRYFRLQGQACSPDEQWFVQTDKDSRRRYRSDQCRVP